MADFNFEKVLYEKRGRIAIITMNRPERMNAIDPQTSAEMHEAFVRLPRRRRPLGGDPDRARASERSRPETTSLRCRRCSSRAPTR